MNSLFSVFLVLGPSILLAQSSARELDDKKLAAEKQAKEFVTQLRVLSEAQAKEKFPDTAPAARKIYTTLVDPETEPKPLTSPIEVMERYSRMGKGAKEVTDLAETAAKSFKELEEKPGDKPTITLAVDLRPDGKFKKPEVKNFDELAEILKDVQWKDYTREAMEKISAAVKALPQDFAVPVEPALPKPEGAEGEDSAEPHGPKKPGEETAPTAEVKPPTASEMAGRLAFVSKTAGDFLTSLPGIGSENPVPAPSPEPTPETPPLVGQGGAPGGGGGGQTPKQSPSPTPSPSTASKGGGGGGGGGGGEQGGSGGGANTAGADISMPGTFPTMDFSRTGTNPDTDLSAFGDAYSVPSAGKPSALGELPVSRSAVALAPKVAPKFSMNEKPETPKREPLSISLAGAGKAGTVSNFAEAPAAAAANPATGSPGAAPLGAPSLASATAGDFGNNSPEYDPIEAAIQSLTVGFGASGGDSEDDDNGIPKIPKDSAFALAEKLVNTQLTPLPTLTRAVARGIMAYVGYSRWGLCAQYHLKKAVGVCFLRK